MSQNYTPPTFKKGDEVRIRNTDKTGTIEHVSYLMGHHWYEIKGKFYSDTEIQKK